jgi:hypothetical protein
MTTPDDALEQYINDEHAALIEIIERIMIALRRNGIDAAMRQRIQMVIDTEFTL